MAVPATNPCHTPSFDRVASRHHRVCHLAASWALVALPVELQEAHWSQVSVPGQRSRPGDRGTETFVAQRSAEADDRAEYIRSSHSRSDVVLLWVVTCCVCWP